MMLGERGGGEDETMKNAGGMGPAAFNIDEREKKVRRHEGWEDSKQDRTETGLATAK